jgi:hypothetical protein
VWDPEAFKRLRRVWMAAKEPDAALQAFDRLEAILSTDADQQEESRDQQRRFLVVPPIGVILARSPKSVRC